MQKKNISTYDALASRNAQIVEAKRRSDALSKRFQDFINVDATTEEDGN